MQTHKIPDAVRGVIIARAWDGETFAHIARDLGVSSHQVGRIAMREGGFPTRAELIRLQGDAICAAYQRAAAWRRLQSGLRFRTRRSRTRCTRVAFGRKSRGGGSGSKPAENRAYRMAGGDPGGVYLTSRSAGPGIRPRM